MVLCDENINLQLDFQKYLIQHDFSDEKDKYQSTTVAFWTNLGMISFLMYLIQFTAVYIVVKISFIKVIKNIYPVLIACIAMIATSVSLRFIYGNGVIYEIISIIICIIVYFGVLSLFPDMKIIIKENAERYVQILYLKFTKK